MVSRMMVELILGRRQASDLVLAAIGGTVLAIVAAVAYGVFTVAS